MSVRACSSGERQEQPGAGMRPEDDKGPMPRSGFPPWRPRAVVGPPCFGPTTGSAPTPAATGARQKLGGMPIS
jgi:hypothetical protein